MSKIINLNCTKEEIPQIVRVAELLWGKRSRINEGWKFEIAFDNEKLHVSIMESKKVIIQPSDSSAIELAEKIVNSVIKTAEIPYRLDKSPHSAHAKNIFIRISDFVMKHEIDRCAIIILVDAAFELLLRARIDQIALQNNLKINSSSIINRKDLYKIIEDNDYIIPYKEDIVKIRTKIRNDIMHLGKIPPVETTKYCISILEKKLKY